MDAEELLRKFAAQYQLAGITAHKGSMNPAESLLWDAQEFLDGYSGMGDTIKEIVATCADEILEQGHSFGFDRNAICRSVSQAISSSKEAEVTK
jgi:hypothetical protein